MTKTKLTQGGNVGKEKRAVSRSGSRTHLFPKVTNHHWEKHKNTYAAVPVSPDTHRQLLSDTQEQSVPSTNRSETRAPIRQNNLQQHFLTAAT